MAGFLALYTFVESKKIASYILQVNIETLFVLSYGRESGFNGSHNKQIIGVLVTKLILGITMKRSVYKICISMTPGFLCYTVINFSSFL